MKYTRTQLIQAWRTFLEEVEANIEEETDTTESLTKQEAMDTLYKLYDTEVAKKADLEYTQEESKGENIYRSENKVEKYVVISDLHIPFHLDEVDKILELHASKEVNLVIAGDALDCFDISVYPKSKSVSFANEVNIFKELLVKCCKLFKKVYLIGGNHEARHSTYLRKRLSAEVASLIGADILENITNSLRLPNLYYTSGDTNNWYVQIDNVIIAHPSSYRKAILGTAQDTYNYFDARGTDALVFLLGHTHALGITVHKNRVIGEIGCLCKEQDYSLSGNTAYNPATNGYCYFYSHNNKVTFNDITLVRV